MILNKKNPLIIACGLAICALSANATTIDFDTVATGSSILTTPLVTDFGTVTYMGVNSAIFGPYDTNTTNWLHSSNSPTAGYTSLAFDFDVSSITFDYTGFGFGSFFAQVLDINGNVIGSFNNSDAGVPAWHLGESLIADGIREFRFRDTVSIQAGVDNVNFTASSVPEGGASIALLGAALAGVVALRRRFTRG